MWSGAHDWTPVGKGPTGQATAVQMGGASQGARAWRVCGWRARAYRLPILLLGVHAVDDAGVLCLEGAHVILRGLDRVLLGELVAVVGPLLRLLYPARLHPCRLLAQRRPSCLSLLLVLIHSGDGLLHLLLVLLLDGGAARAEELLLRLLEAPPLLALATRRVRLRMVAVLVSPPLEVRPRDIGAVGGGARWRERSAP